MENLYRGNRQYLLTSRVFAQTTIRIIHHQDEAAVPDNIGGEATDPDNIGGEANVPDNTGREANVPANIGGEADNREGDAMEIEEPNEVIDQPEDGSVTKTESDLGHQNGPISRGTIAKPKVVPKSPYTTPKPKSGPIAKPQPVNQSLPPAAYGEAGQDFMNVFSSNHLRPRSD